MNTQGDHVRLACKLVAITALLLLSTLLVVTLGWKIIPIESYESIPTVHKDLYLSLFVVYAVMVPLTFIGLIICFFSMIKHRNPELTLLDMQMGLFAEGGLTSEGVIWKNRLIVLAVFYVFFFGFLFLIAREA